MRKEETYEDLLTRQQAKKDLDREINKAFDENQGIKIGEVADKVMEKFRIAKGCRERLILYIFKGIVKR